MALTPFSGAEPWEDTPGTVILNTAQMCIRDSISINPQTKQQKTLDLIGRPHSAADIEAAVARTGNHFQTLNMDLILGLPQEEMCIRDSSMSWLARHFSPIISS